MPGEPQRVVRTVRIEAEVWEQLDAAARDVGMDRSALVRQICRWYVGIPGAKLPPRPDDKPGQAPQ